MKMLSLWLFTLVLAGCSSINPASFATYEINQPPRATTTRADHEINYHGMPLRSGQILVSNNKTPLSFFITLTDQEYHPYTHAGIISIEGGKPYLYHAVAKLKLLVRGSLTDKTKGGIERLPLKTFMQDKAVVAIYRLASAELEKSIADFAVKSYQEKLPYDALFDEKDSSKVYCSEFIVRAMESVDSTPFVLRPRSRHPSIDAVYKGLGIQSVHHYFVRDLLTNASRVGLFSQSLTQAQIEIYFALRKELYRRFTPDQKIGNIMTWTGTGLVFRDAVTVFLERGIRQDFRPRYAHETLQQWVAALANDVFGPVG